MTGQESDRGLVPVTSLFAIAVFVVAILMATLAPFEFHWLSARRAPLFLVTRSDVAQNILLFAPLGLVLASGTRIRLWHAAVLGVVLSSSVEFAQLSIIGRSSNYVDIITNGLGTIVGWAYGRVLTGDKSVRARDLDFGLVALPLCWIVAIRSINEPSLAVLMVPVAVAGLASWRRALSRGAKEADGCFRAVHLAIWLAAALLPLLYGLRHSTFQSGPGVAQGLGLLWLVAVACIGLLLPVERITRPLQSWLIGAALAGFVVADGLWFYGQGAALQWTARVHLHWTPEMACLALLIYLKYQTAAERV